MKLPGPAFEELQHALLDAFNTYTSLSGFARTRLDLSLDTISQSQNREEATTALIGWAERGDRVKALVRKAQAANETNAALVAFIDNHRDLGFIKTADLSRLAESLARLDYTAQMLLVEARQQNLWRYEPPDPTEVLDILKRLADAPTLTKERNHVCKLATAVLRKVGGTQEDLQAWLAEYDLVRPPAARNSAQLPASNPPDKKRWSVLVPLATGIGGALVALLIVFLCRDEKPQPLDACIAAGRRMDRPYVIQSAVMHVQATRTSVGRRDITRTTYTVLPLKDFAAVSDWFEEGYGTNYGALTRWLGTEPESDIKLPKVGATNVRYNVRFAGTSNSPRTIMTGVDNDLPYPLPADRRYIGGILEHVPPNEDVWIYPNKEDVICELTIVLESRDWNLKPNYLGAYRVTSGMPARDVIDEHPTDPMHRGSLTKRWTMLVPNETVAISYAMSDATP